MSSLTIAIVVAFCIGYFFIAVESVTKVNKAAVALLMFVICWTIFMVDPGSYLTAISGQDLPNVVSGVIEHHLGSTSTTLFFLMGAMTIVEIVDQNGGFNWVRVTFSGIFFIISSIYFFNNFIFTNHNLLRFYFVKISWSFSINRECLTFVFKKCSRRTSKVYNKSIIK